MKRTSSDELLPTPTHLPESDLLPATLPDTSAEQAQSEPTLFNRTAANPSMEMVDDVNRPSTPVHTHSALEKSPRSTNAILVALPNTTDDSLENLKKAALSGDKKAQFNVGVMYDEGEAIQVDKEKAFEWYQKPAGQGHPGTQFTVAMMYYEGEVVEENKEKAFEWFHKAAVQADLNAQFNVGVMYDKGEGVEVNKEKAFEWYHRAAVQGYSEAQFTVGVMYVKGEGVEVNKVKAFEWYHKAAVQGYSKAQFSVAAMYDEGEGVRQNKEKAFEWFHKAAVQGNLDAQFIVAVMYDKGEVVEENKEKAFEWFKKAAEQGEDDAMKYLCDFYKDGQGVEKNLPLATYWLLKCYFESTNIDSIDGEYKQLFEFIPSILANFADFKMVDSISFLFTGRISIAHSVIEDSYFSNVANFIKIDSKIKFLKLFCATKLSDYEANLLTEALKDNTQLSNLEFIHAELSEEMNDQIEVLLTQNRDIAELRQYVEDLKIQMTPGFPLDIVKLMVDKMIVANLKSGQTKEATKNAIDELLMIASTTALAKDSKTS